MCSLELGKKIVLVCYNLDELSIGISIEENIGAIELYVTKDSDIHF